MKKKQETPINESNIEKTEDNDINPFDETPEEDDLEEMFDEEEQQEETEEEQVEEYEEEKPKVFTKKITEVEENNEEGSVGLLSLSVILSTILVILIGLVITLLLVK